ncbi:hypothetical protein F0562_014756 [Nyssa sinensis]|uniref:arginase n=1 Tax=Nyssa sinensis TaxID=561372 RepID=A0A5J4ZPS8_9ASTE|nr:hypothetical protein F0562_014756 [Nyssa sinensis]
MNSAIYMDVSGYIRSVQAQQKKLQLQGLFTPLSLPPYFSAKTLSNFFIILSTHSVTLRLIIISSSSSSSSSSLSHRFIFLYLGAEFTDMRNVGRLGIHYLHKLNAANVPTDLIEKGQNRVIEASLTLIRERAKLKGELVRALGGAVASSSLLGVPLGHNSSFLQGPAFAPPRIREAIWCGSTNSTTEEGKELNDPRVLTDVGDLPVQEIRDCGVDDDRLMNIISESVKLVMEEDPLRPLILGGDHSISFPVVRAVSEKLGGPVDILHLDAHPDIYHSFEGNKYSHASSFARIMEGGYARRLLQVGIRSITREGREQGKRFGVEQFEMRTFSRDRHLLENLKLGEGVKGVYISLDVDCLDPAFAPGVSHIEPGGLSFRDVLNILHNLQADVVAADVVEFNPQRDTVDGMTAMVAAKLVRELTAKISK